MTATKKPRYDEGSIAPAENNPMSRRLLCIGLGVDDYDDLWLDKLSFADTDVRKLHGALSSDAAIGGPFLQLKTDTNAVQAVADIRSFLHEHKARQGDRVLFCFAGHGMLVADAGQVERQYLLLRKADTRALLDGHVAGNDVLAVHSLLALFDEFPATFALLIDACRLPARQLVTPFAGQTRDAIRVGLVGRAMQGLRSAFPRRYGPGLPEPGAPVAAPGPAGHSADGRHLLVYSSGEFDQAHEVSSLGGGLFLSTFTNWLQEKLHADELAVIDQDWVAVMAERMSVAARSVHVTIPQCPWISHPDRVFALHRPGDNTGRGPARSSAAGHPVPPVGAAPAPTSTPQAVPRPMPAASAPRPSAPVAVPVDVWTKPWFRLRPLHEAWCPVFIHLSPALTGLAHGLAIMEDPVIWSQWWAIMGRRPADMPTQALRIPMDNVPVTGVSRADGEEFAARLTARLAGQPPGCGVLPLRLPSDLEWTLACACGPVAMAGRSNSDVGVGDAVFRWSSLGQGHASKNNPAAPQEVSHRLNRRNAWGLRGMHGNVRELAWHHRQASRTLSMGGGWRSEVPFLRPDHSSQFAEPEDDVGFRLVRSLMPGEAAILEGRLQP